MFEGYSWLPVRKCRLKSKEMESEKTDLIIHPGATIRTALEQMGRNGEKCLVVVDNKQSVKGTISDGDI